MPLVVCPACGKQFANRHGMGGHVQRCTVTPEQLFWSHIEKTGHNGCWVWTYATDKCGYGNLQWKGKHTQAHRVAWTLLRGDPGKLDCLHKLECQNPSCCNPDHLYLGTQLENSRDRVVLKRHAWGEKVKRNKLKTDDVLVIRGLHGKVKAKELAAKYGVSACHISQIWCRRMWANLP